MLKVNESVRDSLIVDSISEWIWEYDLLTGETNTAKELISFLNYDKNEITEHMNFWLTLIHIDDVTALLNAFNDVIENKSSYFIAEYRIKSKYEGYKWVKSRGKALKNEDGKNIYIAGYHIDISESIKIPKELKENIGDTHSASLSYKNNLQVLSYIKNITEQKKMIEENKKLLEQRIEYDRLKTEFFSNISHDLRTPLNIILSSIQLLNYIYSNSKNSYTDFTAAFEKYIGIMKQNSYRLLKLINNIIDLSRLDSGFLSMNFNNHNIVEIVENITLSVADYIENKGINLIFDTNTEEKIIACDDDKIERIILNLLSNAVKYTKFGGTIKVEVNDIEDSVLISVTDTGCGIPADKLDLIFERFRQVDEVLTRKSEGSGIGLSLVKALVETLGGTIKVSSTYGIGSSFIISFPSKTMENNEIIYKPLAPICNEDETHKKVQKISVEFSDIYS